MINMSVERRLESIEAIAALLAGAPAEARFVTENGRTVLRVKAGGEKWALASIGAPARDRCSFSMLLSIAIDAGVCPNCCSAVDRPRQPGIAQRHCGNCGHRWAEQRV